MIDDTRQALAFSEIEARKVKKKIVSGVTIGGLFIRAAVNLAGIKVKYEISRSTRAERRRDAGAASRMYPLLWSHAFS